MTYDISADAPLFWFKMDQTSGTTLTNSGSTPTSSNTIGSGITINQPGISGRCITSNGSATSYVDTPLSNSFMLDKIFSVEAWVKTTSNNHTVCGFPNGTVWWLYLNTTGNILFHVGGSTSGLDATSTSTINDGNWHHIVGVCNTSGSLTTLTIYVDGTAQASTTATNIGTVSGTGNFRISEASATYSWVGSLDEIAVYDSVLSPTSVTSHYNAGMGIVVPVNATVTPPATTVSIAAPVAVATGTNGSLTAAQDFSAMSAGITPTGWSGGIINSGAANTYPATKYLGMPGLGSDISYTAWTATEGEVLLKYQRAVGSVAGTGVYITIGNCQLVENSQTGLLEIDQSGVGVVATSTTSLTSSLVMVWVRFKVSGLNVYAKHWLDGTTEPSWQSTGTRSIATPTGNIKLARTSDGAAWTTFFGAVNVGSLTVPTPASNVTNVAPAATVAVSAPNAVLTINASAVATPATISVNSVAPTVSSQGSILIVPDATTISVTAPGGFVADNTITAQAATVNVAAGQAAVFQLINASTTAPATTISIAAPAVTFDNQTNTTVTTTAGKVTVKGISLFSKTEDRWYQKVQVTTEAYDVWYLFDEHSGSTVIDEIGSAPSLTFDPDYPTSPVGHFYLNGKYSGGVELLKEGPYGRHAIGLNGSDAYVRLNYELNAPGTTAQEDNDGNSFEIAFATTSDGPLLSTYDGSARVEIINGKIVLIGNGHTYNTNVFVSDGAWHHLIGSTDSSHNTFIYLDGKVIFRRVQNDTGFDQRMRFIGTRPANYQRTFGNGDVLSTGLAVGYLEADICWFVGRADPINESLATELFYEFSLAIINHVTPALATVKGVGAARVKGNTKRMIVLYGLPYNVDANGNWYGADESVWSGMSVEAYNKGWTTPTPFKMGDFLCYPVHIYDGRLSAPGLIDNSTWEVNGQWYDNITGKPRFVNLQNDLAINIEDFDVITAINFPQDKDAEGTVGFFGENTNPFANVESAHEFLDIRQGLVNSILDANANGLQIWAGEPEFAKALGIIQGYVQHTGLLDVNMARQYSVGNADIKARQIDLSYFPNADGFAGVGGAGGGAGKSYGDEGQSIWKRRIVGTVTGLTDIPSWEMIDTINYAKWDYLSSHAFAFAAKYQEFTQLNVGDEIGMPIKLENIDFSSADVWSDGLADRNTNYPTIISALPDGIVGTVVAVEQANYWNKDVLTPNPWANNATTIAVEKGTTLNGRPTGARIFVELMDNGGATLNSVEIDSPETQTMMNGAVVSPDLRSNWSVDSRRIKETLSYYTWNKYNELGAIIAQDQVTTVDVGDATRNLLPHAGFQYRGLKWLLAEPQDDPGTARINVPAAKVNVSSVSPAVAAQRNTTVNASATRIFVQAIKPANIADPNATVIVFGPGEIRFNGLSTQTTIATNAATVTIVGVEPTVTGSGQDMVVYFEFYEPTVYLMEDM